jgi:predicted membrane channel-forming protein YqfA (hemolysin III family)
MPLKIKYIVAVLLGSLAVIIFGCMKKITHQPQSDVFLKIGFYALIGSLVALIIKTLLAKDNYLNK